MNIREAGGAIQTDNIALDVAGVGTATGAGTGSAAGALNYNVILKEDRVSGERAGDQPSGSEAGVRQCCPAG